MWRVFVQRNGHWHDLAIVETNFAFAYKLWSSARQRWGCAYKLVPVRP